MKTTPCPALPDLHTALPLLGGLSASQFMRRHWQRKPLLVRGAIADFKPLLTRAQLVALAAQEEVESRLITAGTPQGWTFARGPFARKQIPPFAQRQWTLLVQGVDLHHEAAHALMRRFAFIPDARLDDLMISYATDGGGVGPHFDSYDVFLLQAHGTRRWRIGRQKDRKLLEGLPVRILADFQPEEEYLCEPGDLLYLPPGWAHDGVAVGECMTYSVGFRVPQRGDLARELLARMADEAAETLGEKLYGDAGQSAVRHSAAIPEALFDFARRAVRRAARDRDNIACALGEYLSEPKANVYFDAPAQVPPLPCALRLHIRSRMLYDARHLFLNGESWRASGHDARLLRHLADTRALDAAQVGQLGADARAQLQQWLQAGWVCAAG